MSAGTKIFLACGVLIVGTLVVYYTVIMGGDSQPLDVDNPDVTATPAAVETDDASGAEAATPAPPPASGDRPGARPAAAASVTMGEPTGSSGSASRTPTPRPTEALPQRGGNRGGRNALPGNGTSPGSSPGAFAGSPETRVPSPSGRPASDGGKDLPDDEARGTPAAADAGSARSRRTTPPPRNNGAPRNAGGTTPRPGAAGPGRRSGTGTPARPTPTTGRPSRSEPTPVTTPAYQDYFVQPGDTLSSISSDWFGDESKWELIAAANPGIQPDRIRPGDLLRLPPKTTPRRKAAQPERPVPKGNVYTVKSGDTLSEISKAVWGRASLWQHIYDANRDIIGDDHHALKIGMVLRIPPRPSAG